MKWFQRDRGSVSIYLSLVSVVFILMAGFVVDSGRKTTALTEASHIAQAAARAGAQEIDLDALRTTGDLVFLTENAVQRALDYIAGLGHIGQASVDNDTISVTVQIIIANTLLPIGPLEVSATRTATAVTEGPGT